MTSLNTERWVCRAWSASKQTTHRAVEGLQACQTVEQRLKPSPPLFFKTRAPPATLRTNNPTFTPPRQAEVEVWMWDEPCHVAAECSSVGAFPQTCYCRWKHNISWLCGFKIKAFKWINNRGILLWRQSFVRGDWSMMLQGGGRVHRRSLTAAEDKSIISWNHVEMER